MDSAQGKPKKNPGHTARVFDCLGCEAKASGDGAETGAHQPDRIHVGLLPRILLGALARLVTLVEQFDLLEFLEGFAKQRLGVFQLDAKFIGGTGQVLPPLDRRLGVGRVGEVGGIVDPGPLLFGLDFPLEIDLHALKIGDHALDLGNPSPLFVDLKLLQADQRFT